MKKLLIIIILIILLITIIFLFYKNKENKKEENKFTNISYYRDENKKRYYNYYNKNKHMPTNKIVLHVNMNLDKKEYTNIKIIKKPNLYTLVNKYYKLNNNFYPKNLTTIDKKYTNKNLKIQTFAVKNLYKMLEDMKKQNLNPMIVSAFRTKKYQTNLYNTYKEKDKLNVDTYSARPRHSEHELGLSVDITSENMNLDNFKDTKEFMWLKYNSYKYGFILRYPKNKQNITKYIYEPWHYRYIGLRHAKKIHKLNLSYEEYYSIYIKY